MNKKLISLVTVAAITFTSVSPVFAKNFTSKQNVALNHAWTVKFNKTLGSNQDFSKVTIKDSNGTVVPVDVTVNSDKQSVKVAPKESYSSNTNYILTLDGIKDINNNNLKENATMQFTTVDQPTEDIAILPQAVTFNADGSVTPITTNEYVEKTWQNKDLIYTLMPNPNFDKSFGMKCRVAADMYDNCFIDADNALNFQGVPYSDTTTFSDSFKYNKYMKDQMRELYKGFIGTTPYDCSHYLSVCDNNRFDGIHNVAEFDFREITATDNISNFTYYFPVNPIVSDAPTLGYNSNPEFFKHAKANANLVIYINNTKLLDNNTAATTNFRQSLYDCFGTKYVDKILDFMLQERQKARDYGETWDGNDTISIGNISIYGMYYGHYYSFFFK